MADEQLIDPLPPATAPGETDAQKLSTPPPQGSNTINIGNIPLVNALPTYLASVWGVNYDRLSKPGYQQTYTLGVVPRRGWDAQTSRYIRQCNENPQQGLTQWAESAPLRLLHVLGDVHPLVSAARSLWLAIAFGEEDTAFSAVNADGSDNEDGSEAIAQLLKLLPAEAGGIVGLQKAFGEQVLFYGTVVGEGVLSQKSIQEGLTDIVSIDPASIRFRDETNGVRFLEQKQIALWRKLPDFTCYAAGYEASRDNPYGRPVFAGVLGEALNDLARQSNLNDVLKNIAYPRLTIGFPWQEIAEYAAEHPEVLIGRTPDGGDLEPGQYAQAELQRLYKMLTSLKADDIIVYPKDGMVDVLSGAEGLDKLAVALEQQRLRICQGLNTLPSLLGIDTGGTLAYAAVQWGVQVKMFESFRAFVNRFLCRFFDLHLRLLGINAVSRAEVNPIKASESFVDEQAMQLQIANQTQLVSLGYIDRTNACLAITGEPPVVDDATQKANEEAEQQKQLQQAQQMQAMKQPRGNGDTAGDKNAPEPKDA